MAYSGPASDRMSSRSQRANNATSSANAIALASAGRAYESFVARLWSFRPCRRWQWLAFAQLGPCVDGFVSPVLQVTGQRPTSYNA